jgi:hypothetical protein
MNTDAAPADRRSPRPATERTRAMDQLELEAIRRAFDEELDSGSRIPFEVVRRICRTFAAHLRTYRGRA